MAAVLAAADPAQAQVDPSGRWRTLHTEHFRVHFRLAHGAVADRAAREAERAWTLLAGELYPPRGVVDVTLADDVDAANGFASVFPSNRLTVFLTTPATDVALQPYDDWLRLVIVHELAHLFHLDRTRGLWAGLQQAFGRAPGLFPNAYQPSWVSEGVATYYESRFTAAGRAEGSFHTQLLEAAAGGDGRSPRDALSFSRWPAGYTPYAYGGRFFARTARAVGDSLVPRFVAGSAGQLIPFRVGRPLARAGAPDLDRRWRLATGGTPAAAGADSGRLLVAGLRNPPVPRVSPDGRRVAYLHDDGKGAPRLRVAPVEHPGAGRSRRVTGDARYDWLGDTLFVTQLDFTDRRHVRTDLYRWEPAGAWRRVTRGARVTEPRGGGGMLALVRHRPGGNDAVVGHAPDPGAEWGAVVPAPDGRWIAGARHRAGRWTLVRWPAAAPDAVTILLDAGGVVSDPVWTADGAILFVWDGSGLPQVLRWETSGRLAVLTADPHGARHPAPLADGRVLYTTLRADGWQLRRARLVPVPVVAAPAPAPFDSAPPVATRESGYALWPSLRPHFWIPLAADAGVAGRFGGALTAGTDAVGRFAYVASLRVAGRRMAGGAAVVSEAWSNPTLDGSFVSDWSGLGRTASGIAVSRLEQDAALGVTWVTRRWRSQASLRVAAEYERDRFATEPDTALVAVCSGCTARDLAGASATIALGHVVTAPLAISPQDGFAWSITARRQERQGGAGWAEELRSRLALYLHLPGGGFAHPVVAARVAMAAATGPVAERFGVGGVSGGVVPAVAGQTLTTRRSFPVRGYDADAVVGRRALAAAIELRVPLALVGRSLGHLPLGLDRLAGTVFADAGDAWEGGDLPNPPRLRSVGVELIGDLTVSYDFPLRLRLGAARPLAAAPAGGGRAVRGYVTLGSDF